MTAVSQAHNSSYRAALNEKNDERCGRDQKPTIRKQTSRNSLHKLHRTRRVRIERISPASHHGKRDLTVESEDWHCQRSLCPRRHKVVYALSDTFRVVTSVPNLTCLSFSILDRNKGVDETHLYICRYELRNDLFRSGRRGKVECKIVMTTTIPQHCQLLGLVSSKSWRYGSAHLLIQASVLAF